MPVFPGFLEIIRVVSLKTRMDRGILTVLLILLVAYTLIIISRIDIFKETIKESLKAQKYR